MAEMDIDMDIDLEITEEDLGIQNEIPVAQVASITVIQQEPQPILSSPNDTTEPDALDPAPQKVHLRGLDNLTTDDIKAFVSEYYTAHRHSRIEWINDTSANVVYETAEVAKEALAAFAAVELVDQIPVLETVQAKAFPQHPDTNLQVRLAVVGDRKQRGARDQSRFYLMNPEYDPTERRKRGGYRGGRSYRDRDDGGYRSQRYDDREQEKREREADFDASLYDDDEVAIAKRTDRGGRTYDSSSGGESRGRRGGRYGRANGRELFPENEGRSGGRLRDRSASPLRDDADSGKREALAIQRRQEAATANRMKAQILKAKLRENSAPRELFPEKVKETRTLGRYDAVDDAADLFAKTISVPLMDGGNDYYRGSGGSLESRITKVKPNTGFNIRGAARLSPAPGPTFNIKGAAKVKELFPNVDNSGKELFAENMESRGRRRQKAEDLFH